MPAPPEKNDDWDKWANYVLGELTRQARVLEETPASLRECRRDSEARATTAIRLSNERAMALRMEFHEFETKMISEIATLKAKSGVWGALGGVATSALIVGGLLLKALIAP